MMIRVIVHEKRWSIRFLNKSEPDVLNTDSFTLLFRCNKRFRCLTLFEIYQLFLYVPDVLRVFIRNLDWPLFE